MALKKKIVFLPYDFDTAIGITNEGTLAFSYNLEDTDQTESGADVFNGQQSVLWNNIRAAFGSELMAMYQSLRSTGAISYAKVERMFEEHQGKWPEAVFNEDAWFKYLAPLEEKGSAAYLSMLQGSKAEQRKWWLYNRFRYLDSKYNAGDALTDVITLRGYAKADVTITPYADIYATVKFGSYLVQTRAQRNQSYTLECPLDNVNDTEIYLYSASQLSSVGDLSGLKVGYAEFSYATRLRSLKLGDSSRYYSNGNLTELHLGNNTLLQTLDVRNCTGLGTGDQKTIDISGCTGIENIYFDGTAIAGLTLPNGGAVKILHLPGTITALTILNQSQITDFICPDVTNITTLRLENVSDAIDSLEILDSIPANSRVRLIGFTWEADLASEISGMLDTLDSMRGLDQNGSNVATAQVYGTIHVPTVTGSVVASANRRYPDITIAYDHITAVIYYYSDDGLSFLGSETITDGANAQLSLTHTKEPTSEYTYSFAGWAAQAGAQEADPDILVNVRADKNVYEVYAATPRTYTVRFWNGSTLLKTFTNVPYGTSVTYDVETEGTPVWTGSGSAEDYRFTGFSPDGSNIAGTTDCYAQFEYVAQQYKAFLEGTLAKYSDRTGLATITENAFLNLTALTEVSFPTLTAVPVAGFRYCQALESVDLPEVTNVGNYGFFQCTALKALDLPKLTLLGTTNTLAYCTSLTTALFPNLVGTASNGSLSTSIFAGDTAIATLDIGKVKSLGSNDFTALRGLTTLIIRNEDAVITTSGSSSLFYSSGPISRSNGHIIVPDALVEAYQTTGKWANYSACIEPISDYPEYEIAAG